MLLMKVYELSYFHYFNANFLHFLLIKLEFNFWRDFLFFKRIWAIFANRNLKMIVNIKLYLQHFYVNMGPNMDFYMHFAKIDLLQMAVSTNFSWEIYPCYLRTRLLFFVCQLLRFMELLNCFILLEKLLFAVFNRYFDFLHLFFNHLRRLFIFLKLVFFILRIKFFLEIIKRMILNLIF